MDESARRYAGMTEECNDEAGTKAYTLEIILATLRKVGKATIDNVDKFKANIPEFATRNPFLKIDRP